MEKKENLKIYSWTIYSILLHILSDICSYVRIDPAWGLSLCRGRVAAWELAGTRPEMEITKNINPEA